MRKPLLSVLAIAACASLGAASAAETWNMASGYPDNNYHTKNVRLFLDDLTEASGGKLEVVLHNNQSLVKLPEIKRAVQTGQVQLGDMLSPQYSNEDRIHEASSIPFFADNIEKAAKLWNITKPIVADRLAKQGVRLLFGVPWPSQGFYTEEPISTASDFDGVKFRVYSKSTARMAEELGALPTRVEFSEVPQAFATGLVGAMYTSAQTGIDSQAWDFTKYFTNVGGNHTLNYVVVNERAFQGLDADVQQAILDAAARAEPRGWKMTADVNADQVQFLNDNGMTIAEPTAEFRAELGKVGKTLIEEWVKEAGAVGEEVFAKFMQ